MKGNPRFVNTEKKTSYITLWRPPFDYNIRYGKKTSVVNKTPIFSTEV